ncbi:hypothetical protein V9T40_008116 [Parthenolecanium corni]|uniref:Uncharacterized protein n=1 Tax=Parthenolecanium corni TaxID=536013 RepID=A0AAN9TPK1_9HEMI
MEVIRKMEVPTSQEAKIVNGKFDKGGALKLMENTNSDNKVDQDKVKAILDACEKQVENETDECNIAGKLAACVFDEAKKVGSSQFNSKIILRLGNIDNYSRL